MKRNHFSRNATEVLQKRYLRRNASGEVVESPAELFQRVAKTVAQAELMTGNSKDAERWEEIFLQMLISRDFLPNSPTLMNAGTTRGQLSACFVLPINDSMESIFEAVKQMALVQRTGGGTGFSFSRLRPRSDLISSTGGKASGPVAFMMIFDAATFHIKQGGRRRGANMGILRVDHPDIITFIRAKKNAHALQNFNLSVAVTDAFMSCVTKNGEYDLIHPADKKKAASVRAAEVFDEIVDAAWHTGDPGLIFSDAVNGANPTPHVGSLEATNPCGEIPLMDYESCNLGAINLAHMLENADSAINWVKLRSVIRKAVRFLDDTITINRYPIPEIEMVSRANRKIGLGVMGFSEMLIRMGISYDSDEAERIGSDIMKTINEEALAASLALAKDRGAYANWRGSTHDRNGLYIRNATRTALAPTGTLSIIADTTPGIEPLFALAYRRQNVLDGQELVEGNRIFMKYIEQCKNKDHILDHISEKGTIAGAENVPQKLKRIFKTALEIPFERHLGIQAAFQGHTDNSVSKTINLREESTREDVAKAFHLAWRLKLKGVTVYRHGSKTRQVIAMGKGKHPNHAEHGAECDGSDCRL